MAIRCTGRIWPNAPANASTGKLTRLPPHYFWVRWDEGFLGPFVGLNGVWNLITFSGNPSPGLNRRVNWNGQPAAGVNINFSIQWEAPNAFRLWYDITWTHGFQVEHNLFRSSAVPGFDWIAMEGGGATLNTPKYEPIHPNDGIADAFIKMRFGTYANLPADSCL